MRTLLASFFVLLSLSVAAVACPNYQAYGATYRLTGSQLYSPQNYSVIAGGSQSLRNCGYNHTGYVISSPDFSFNLSGMAPYNRLEIEVTQQSCDTVLLVNSANATWFFDDDSRGNLHPRVNLHGQSNISGWVDVWVGTYGTSTCSATLQMETWYN